MAMSPRELIDQVWQHSLFDALYGRRSRRFGRGFESTEGPFQYRSQHPPEPLNELEEALLVAAGAGASGAPLWDASRPPGGFRAGDGRTFPSTSRGRRTALFFTNDTGVYVIDPSQVAATKIREVETPAERERILTAYRQHRKELNKGRLAIPRRVPPLFAHNMQSSNMPGSTLFMPVCDVSLSLIAITSQLVDRDGGRFVGKHGGGMYVVDDRHGGRPAGTEPWAESGFLDREKVLPLSILERQACYFMFSEPAAICQNIFLATEALGVGGWMHCGFLSLEVLQAIGFTTVNSSAMAALANPVGLDGVFEGYCPPYYPNMDAAVDAALSGMSRANSAGTTPATSPGTVPYLMSEADHGRGIVEVSEAGIACTKAICNYIYDTYGRFPGGVDTMHLMWFMQAHHLDTEYYDRFFRAGAYGPTHADHMAAWHR